MDTKEQSEFNYAVSFLNRCNNWQYLANLAAYNCEANKWYLALNCYSRELRDDMDENQKTKIKDYKNRGMIIIQKWINTTQNKPMLFMDAETENLLDEYHCYLNDIFKAKGYKTKFKEDILAPESEWSREET